MSSKKKTEIDYIKEVVKREIVISGSLKQNNFVNLPIDIVVQLVNEMERAYESEKEVEHYKTYLESIATRYYEYDSPYQLAGVAEYALRGDEDE